MVTSHTSGYNSHFLKKTSMLILIRFVQFRFKLYLVANKKTNLDINSSWEFMILCIIWVSCPAKSKFVMICLLEQTQIY